MQKDYKCPICNGRQEKSNTIFSVDLGFGIVVIRHVPTISCSICGDEFIEDYIAVFLEKIIADAKSKHRTAEIIDWEYEKTIAS